LPGRLASDRSVHGGPCDAEQVAEFGGAVLTGLQQGDQVCFLANAVDLACSLVEDVDDGWSVVVDYGVVLFLGFFLSHGSAFDDSWAGSVAAVR
jgi:hypothetical protein